MIKVITGGTITYVRPDHVSSVFSSDTKVRINMLSGVTHTITDKDSMLSFMEQFIGAEKPFEEALRDIEEPDNVDLSKLIHQNTGADKEEDDAEE